MEGAQEGFLGEAVLTWSFLSFIYVKGRESEIKISHWLFYSWHACDSQV